MVRMYVPISTVDISLASNTYHYIDADKPIMVTSLTKGYKSDGQDNTDPFLMLHSPVDKALSWKFTFTTMTSIAGSYSNTLAVSCLTVDTANILLDGVAVGATWTGMTGTPYSSTQVSITEGVHVVESSTRTKFVAYLYGQRYRESYAMRLIPHPGTYTFTPQAHLLSDGIQYACGTRPTTAQSTEQPSTESGAIHTTDGIASTVSTAADILSNVPSTTAITTSAFVNNVYTTLYTTIDNVDPTEYSTVDNMDTTEYSTVDNMDTTEYSTVDNVDTTVYSTVDNVDTTVYSTVGNVDTTEYSTVNNVDTTEYSTVDNVDTTEYSTVDNVDTKEYSTVDNVDTTVYTTVDNVDTTLYATVDNVDTMGYSNVDNVDTTEHSIEIASSISSDTVPTSSITTTHLIQTSPPNEATTDSVRINTSGEPTVITTVDIATEQHSTFSPKITSPEGQPSAVRTDTVGDFQTSLSSTLPNTDTASVVPSVSVTAVIDTFHDVTTSTWGSSTHTSKETMPGMTEHSRLPDTNTTYIGTNATFSDINITYSDINTTHIDTNTTYGDTNTTYNDTSITFRDTNITYSDTNITFSNISG